MKTVNVPIKEIKRDGRHRKDMGDIPALWENIKEIGLLQFPVLNKDMDLVIGGRRVAAFEFGGEETIPCVISPDYNTLEKLLQAENDENQYRKEFTISERYAMAKSLETALAEAAKLRKAAKGKKSKKKADDGAAEANGSPESPTPEANGHVEKSEDEVGKSRDLAAKAVNLSGETYRKIGEVVEAASKNKKFEPLVEEMNATGKVNGAFKKLKLAQAPKPKKKEGEGEEEDKVVDATGTVIEQRGLQDKFESPILPTIIEGLLQALTLCRSQTNPLKEVGNWNPWLREKRNAGEETPAIHELMTAAIKAMKAAKEQIEGAKPHLVCKACGGAKCKDCRQTGFWPEWRAKEAEGQPG